MKNNILEVQTDNYYTTFEYSEKFSDLLSSVIAFSSTYKFKENQTLTSEQTKDIGDKAGQLRFDLDTGVIVLNTQEKADKLLTELRADLELLK